MKSSLDKFMEVYTPHLLQAVAQHPEDYGFGPDKVPQVAERMKSALATGSYNHDGRAFKATCKSLGIPYTRTAIEKFLGRERRKA